MATQDHRTPEQRIETLQRDVGARADSATPANASLILKQAVYGFRLYDEPSAYPIHCSKLTKVINEGLDSGAYTRDNADDLRDTLNMAKGAMYAFDMAIPSASAAAWLTTLGRIQEALDKLVSL